MKTDNTTLIFGPPGTGKTTSLLSIVDGLLGEGYDSKKICFVTFTKKAASEAKTRAMEKFALTPLDLPLFRTLHSLAFQQLNVNRAEVMGIRDYIAIANHLGIFISAKGLNDDGTIAGASRGDRLLFMDMMARSRRMPLRDYWEQFPDEDIRFYELDQLSKTISAYKKANDKIDFIDMITKFCAERPQTGLEHLIVDEAQDLSTIQWEMVTCLAESAERVFIAGDDDQAIFTWAGADVEKFTTLPGERVVLEQSYRVPKVVQGVANTIASRIGNRVEKKWNPRSGAGCVDYISDISQVDLSKGTWLLLARNVFLLNALNNHCLTAGFLFESTIGSPIKGAAVEAIVAWEDLRKGSAISVTRALRVYDMMTSKVGVAHGGKTKLEREVENRQVTLDELKNEFGLLTDKIWHEALDRIPEIEREYFLAALRSGEKMLKEPRIKISTIHGVKGGEAENVLLLTDMAQRTWTEFHDNPDAEHRVWYVAVTRAKERLVLVQPKTSMFYEI